MSKLEVIYGDMLGVLPKLAADGVRFHAVVTDPPYHLTSGNAVYDFAHHNGKRRLSGGGFMGKQWDGGDVAFRSETWRAVYEALLPGAYLVAFASTRGYHRMVCAIEDAGFVIHPMLAWISGQGFPKATNLSKQIDKHFGATREVIGTAKGKGGENLNTLSRLNGHDDENARGCGAYGQGAKQIDVDIPVTAPATPEAQQWDGWAYGLQSLKPSIEPICLAQKPAIRAGMVENVLTHGCGALNVDASRIPGTWTRDSTTRCDIRGGRYVQGGSGQLECEPQAAHAAGRWPANVLHDGSPEVLDAFAAFGERTSGSGNKNTVNRDNGITIGSGLGAGNGNGNGGDTGSSARFFAQCPFSEDELRFHYSAKADAADRADSRHPTIKPVSLLRWLVRLITPPGGCVLDPFAGSGTTGEACMLLGFDCTLIERDETHYRDILHRQKRWSGADMPLFAEASPISDTEPDLFAAEAAE